MFERFTDRARNVLVLAQGQANELGHGYIGTEHILLGLILEGEGVAARVLRTLEIGEGAVRTKVVELTPPDLGPPHAGRLKKPPFTPLAKKALELSLRQALSLSHNYIGTEHILLAISAQSEGLAHRILADLGADPDSVRARVLDLLSSSRAASGSEGRPADEILAEAARSMTRSVAGEVPAWSPATQGVMTEATRSVPPGEALTTTDLLAALVRSPQSRAGLVLARLGLTEDRLAQELEAVPLEGSADLPVPSIAISVLDRTTVVDDPEVARWLLRASPEEIREALRRGLPGG